MYSPCELPFHILRVILAFFRKLDGNKERLDLVDFQDAKDAVPMCLERNRMIERECCKHFVFIPVFYYGKRIIILISIFLMREAIKIILVIAMIYWSAFSSENIRDTLELKRNIKKYFISKYIYSFTDYIHVLLAAFKN